MSKLKKLNRLKQHILRDSEEITETNKLLNKNKPSSEIPFIDIWKKENTSVYYLEDDYCFIREVHYPIDHQHGRYKFKDYLTAINMWNEKTVHHPLSAKGYKANDLFFFDTETTGLGGGVGNTIFLLGYASVNETEVILKQHFLPEPGLEIPLYYSFLENINYTTLVTYNGKAFDWPQVKTRHTLIRDHIPKLPSFGHFDLYHASRRLWKSKLESVKLTNVEKEILEFYRKDDIPGYLAPMIYYDYVERKDPEGVINVLKHNEHDILSLITLYTHLSFQILQEDQYQTHEEKVLIGKWFNYLGEKTSAAEVFTVAAEQNEMEAKHELAYFYKREKKFIEARDLWAEVIMHSNGQVKRKACIELAKLMEHQFKDYKSAIEYTNIVINSYDDKIINEKDRFLKDAEKRMSRLLRKY